MDAVHTFRAIAPYVVTTAPDVTIQAQIIDLVKRLPERLGMAVMWITHDLGWWRRRRSR